MSGTSELIAASRYSDVLIIVLFIYHQLYNLSQKRFKRNVTRSLADIADTLKLREDERAAIEGIKNLYARLEVAFPELKQPSTP